MNLSEALTQALNDVGAVVDDVHALMMAVAHPEAQVAAFLQDLVRVPSISERDDEAAVAQYVAA
jgi:acetylornithine deacetylase/succinyl-diaminopimelate desuccinylase-like protein